RYTDPREGYFGGWDQYSARTTGVDPRPPGAGSSRPQRRAAPPPRRRVDDPLNRDGLRPLCAGRGLAHQSFRPPADAALRAGELGRADEDPALPGRRRYG